MVNVGFEEHDVVRFDFEVEAGLPLDLVLGDLLVAYEGLMLGEGGAGDVLHEFVCLVVFLSGMFEVGLLGVLLHVSFVHTLQTGH